MNQKFLSLMVHEILEAIDKYPNISNTHEGYAIIKEEVDEFWDEVKKKPELRNNTNMRKELIQIAAMCWRTAEDCGLME